MADEIRQRAADHLEHRSRTPGRVLVGFDGFIDTIADAVGRRRSAEPGDYEPVRTIADFGARIAASAGRSTNIELRRREARGGGNGPLLAGALAALGVEVTLVGGPQRADDPASIDPAFEEIAALCEKTISIAPAARTDALEFDDGKVMFNWPASLDAVNADTVAAAVPHLPDLCAQADVIATINWTNTAGLGSIWRWLREHAVPADDPPMLFVDLSDPARRRDADLRGALDELRLFPAVTLGLNIAEAERLGTLTGAVGVPIDPADRGALAGVAGALRAATGLDAVVVHTHAAAAAADGSGSCAVATRFVERPAISTGAGDHFNGGFLAARLLGLPLDEALACGVDTATRFVRTGRRPTRAGLVEELRLPVPGI